MRSSSYGEVQRQKQGGSAFPSPEIKVGGDVSYRADAGMTLRDFFATNVATDEIQDITYKHLSLKAQELLAGMSQPEKPDRQDGNKSFAEYHIELAQFHCAVNAALRFMMADAMLKARKKEPQP